MTDVPLRLRYFTPREANEALPELAVKVAQVAELMRLARELDDQARVTEDRFGQKELAHRAETSRDEAQSLMREISEHGVEVKSVEPALLDFPAMYLGREAFLCWRQGEDQIEAWHPVGTGFEGRKPLNFQDLGAWEWCN